MRRPALCRVVFDGQSRVNAPPWEGIVNLGWSWPRLTMAGRGLPGYDQPAIGGTSMTTLASTFATRAAPWIAPVSFEPTIYVLCGGFTDYHDEGNTGAQVYADAGALADLARAAGAQYVICTTTIAVMVTGSWTPAIETQRLAGNALILADASGKFDDTIDFEVEGLDDATDPLSFVDGIHIYGSHADPTHGTGRAAVVAAPAIDAAIAAVT